METPRNSDNYDISIHALRKESDNSRVRLLLKPRYFNPRSP